MKKGTKFYSILKEVCPVCQNDRIFASKNPWSPKHMFRMKPNCQSCGNKFEREPGYWYGAMYVSYALTVAISVTVFTSLYLFFPKTTVPQYLWLIIGISLFFTPWVWRHSRVVWMNFFQGYDASKDKVLNPKNN